MIEMIADKLRKIANKKGANSAKLIPAKEIFVDDYVRLKCKYGCNNFAKRFTCPPYAPSPEETRKLLQGYRRAMLFEFTGLRGREEQRNIHETMYELEREAFLDGLHRAFAYAAGPCRRCKTCAAETIDNPNEFSKRHCRNPTKTRPSMEACGIDVYRTARKAGFKISPVKEGESFQNFGLLLLE